MPGIASLLPGATEMVAALGLADRLVAVSHECDHPPGVEALPRLTGSILPAAQAPAAIDEAVRRAVEEGRPLYRVDGGRLADLAPDLVVTQGVCEVCAVSADTEELRALCSQVRVVTLTGTTFAGVLEDLRLLAAAAGVPERGERVAEELRRAWESLPGPDPRGPRVMMLEWPDPPYSAGHWVPEQVERAGGRDVMGRAGERSFRTSWAALREADPDVLVSIACGYGLEGNLDHLRALAAHPEAGELRALREGRAWACDANAHFSRPGPRLVRGARVLAEILREPGAASAGEGEALRLR